MSALRKLLSILALAAGLAAAGQPKKGLEDYVHGGASLYIQGRLQEASVEVEEGLRKFPGDARLKALAAQLKAMKDQQKQDQGGGEGQGGQGSQDKKDQKDSSRNQNGQGKDQDKKDPQKQDQGKDTQNKDQDKDKDKQGGGKDKEKEKEKEKDGDKDKGKDQGGQDGEPPKEKPGQEGDSTGKGAAPVPPGQMSKEEAERLLNSYQDDEKREQKNMQRRYRKQAEVEEDW
jgi:Ca-activated chloride channel family protein